MFCWVADMYGNISLIRLAQYNYSVIIQNQGEMSTVVEILGEIQMAISK